MGDGGVTRYEGGTTRGGEGSSGVVCGGGEGEGYLGVGGVALQVGKDRWMIGLVAKARVPTDTMPGCHTQLFHPVPVITFISQ